MDSTYEALKLSRQEGSITNLWTDRLNLDGDYRRVVRAALYVFSVEAADLDLPCIVDCARHARIAGFRVVTAVAEDQAVGAAGQNSIGGERLWSLIDRMEDGQFDVILAHTGKGVLAIGKSIQPRQDAAGIQHSDGGVHA